MISATALCARPLPLKPSPRQHARGTHHRPPWTLLPLPRRNTPSGPSSLPPYSVRRHICMPSSFSLKSQGLMSCHGQQATLPWCLFIHSIDFMKLPLLKALAWSGATLLIKSYRYMVAETWQVRVPVARVASFRDLEMVRPTRLGWAGGLGVCGGGSRKSPPQRPPSSPTGPCAAFYYCFYVGTALSPGREKTSMQYTPTHR